MATIECNGRSAIKLRDHDIGRFEHIHFILFYLLNISPHTVNASVSRSFGRRVGFSSFNIFFWNSPYGFVDFLALESLLDLFGSIIPLVKAGRERRSHFIKEVFDPSIFKCSDLVIEHLEHISNPDWSITSMKIIKTLADSDPSL